VDTGSREENASNKNGLGGFKGFSPARASRQADRVQRMIRKSVQRFSEKIMRKQKAKAR
jgi:hypothetical protein